MSLETFNISLFKAINAPITASHFSIDAAIFIANDVLYLLLLFLLVLWCYGDLELKKRALKAVVLTAISIGIGFIISLFYDHPRPFVMGVGRTLIHHAPNASFPSDHMLIFSTIALSYLFSQRKIAGVFLLVLAWMVAWSRVYLGVHFPLDMLGGFSIALLVNLLAKALWPQWEHAIMAFALKIYQFFAQPLLKRGWVK
ncbi:undecaprenyl-diphosphatase [Acinetobacter sp. MD2]|uniref:undecaprenyl-diphosphatase n=1 Tax=Acinetobacter sp. MD2 TaxID=2600066 RepID=UPI002D1EED92|nr:undecaprenyl-diphosphatase [Acinetobacter sp. MD2]MEB3768348.1 undecaprenyl-diphosphatase [Acinetobacter sp. MD2]